MCKQILKEKSKSASYSAGMFLLSLLNYMIPNDSRVSCFISFLKEVSTHEIIMDLYARNCRVFVPTWTEDSMWMVPLHSQEDYMKLVQGNHEKSAHSIPMPENKKEIWDEIDYCIVPGINSLL
jgi:5-formyltetrahydrofolate cyclo-ligase